MSSSPPSILELTTAMAAGDGEAIATFYQRWSPAMLAMTRHAVRGRRDEAFLLDILHDAILRIVRCVRPIESETHLLNWTRLVIQSCALDLLRREQRRQRRERIVAPPESSPEHDDASEEIEWLAAQLAALDPAVARLIDLRFRKGWTLHRIGAALRTSTGQVDGRLRRAIAQLRTDAKAVFDE